MDFSSLVEAGPAGQWGRVKVLPGGDLAFENKPEKKVHFFGFQLLVNHLFEARGSGLAADTEEETRARIRDWVKAVRRQGYNMVRLQAVDLYLMGRTTKDLEFNPVHWDRFEYLVHRLKEEGIYIGVDAMSFIGYRSVGWFEGLAQKYRLRMLVDDEARWNWKQGVAAMMTHVNPYTGLSLARDPMVVFVTCFNEQDLELYWDPVFTPAEIRPFAERKWKTFLAEKYAGRPDDLAIVWGSADADSVPIYTRDHLSAGGERAGDIASFLFKLQDDVTAWYLDQLQEFGYDGLAVQYDVISQYVHHAVHARTPAVANHGYHGHPSDKSNPGSRVQQDGAIKGTAQYFRSRAVARFNDRPFFIT
ncbi:MAG: hypothetical protein U1E27_05035, partial [Kiritimatiellia bacterium]|nr:hypothetical protein [Kiritimatiellia bacterium]